MDSGYPPMSNGCQPLMIITCQNEKQMEKFPQKNKTPVYNTYILSLYRIYSRQFFLCTLELEKIPEIPWNAWDCLGPTTQRIDFWLQFRFQ